MADKDQQYKTFEVPALASVSREDLVAFMANSGLWTFLNQRPFAILPNLTDVPRDIFILTFDLTINGKKIWQFRSKCKVKYIHPHALF